MASTRKFSSKVTAPGPLVCCPARPAVSGFHSDAAMDADRMVELHIDWRRGEGTLLSFQTRDVYDKLGEEAQSRLGFAEFDALMQHANYLVAKTFRGRLLLEVALPVLAFGAVVGPVVALLTTPGLADRAVNGEGWIFLVALLPAIIVAALQLMCMGFLLRERPLVESCARSISVNVLDKLNTVLHPKGVELQIYVADVPCWVETVCSFVGGAPREGMTVSIVLVLAKYPGSATSSLRKDLPPVRQGHAATAAAVGVAHSDSSPAIVRALRSVCGFGAPADQSAKVANPNNGSLPHATTTGVAVGTGDLEQGGNNNEQRQQYSYRGDLPMQHMQMMRYSQDRPPVHSRRLSGVSRIVSRLPKAPGQIDTII